MFGEKEEEEGGEEELEEEAHFPVEEFASVFQPNALKTDGLYFLQEKLTRVTFLLHSTKFKEWLTGRVSHTISYRQWMCCVREKVPSCYGSQVTTIVES